MCVRGWNLPLAHKSTHQCRAVDGKKHEFDDLRESRCYLGRCVCVLRATLTTMMMMTRPNRAFALAAAQQHCRRRRRRLLVHCSFRNGAALSSCIFEHYTTTMITANWWGGGKRESGSKRRFRRMSDAKLSFPLPPVQTGSIEGIVRACVSVNML